MITKEKMEMVAQRTNANLLRRSQIKKGFLLLLDGLTISEMEALLAYVVKWQHMEGWKLPDVKA